MNVEEISINDFLKQFKTDPDGRSLPKKQNCQALSMTTIYQFSKSRPVGISSYTIDLFGLLFLVKEVICFFVDLSKTLNQRQSDQFLSK